MTNKVKDIMQRGGVALKTSVYPPVPAMVELLGYCGVDMIQFNWEFASFDIALIEHLVRAAEVAGVETLVKVPDFNPVVMWDVLDCGVKGILLPEVTNASEVAEAVANVRHSPRGKRRKNTMWGRAAKYGFSADHLKADDDIIVGCEIETPEAVENIDEILAVDGLTYISCGHTDLAKNLGRYPAPPDDPVVLGLFNKILAAVGKRLASHPFPKMNATLGEIGNGAPTSPWTVGRSIKEVVADKRVGLINIVPYAPRRVIDSYTADVQGYRSMFAEKGRG